MEEDKLRLVGRLPLLADVAHGDALPRLQLRAVDDHGGAGELGDGQHIQRLAGGVQVGWGVHVGASVGVEGQAGLPEAALLIAVGGYHFRPLSAWVNGHILFDHVG